MENKYLEDIKYMLNELEKQHICLYFYISKEELFEYISNFIQENPIENDFDFFYVINHILKKINDPHTFVDFVPYRFLPIKLKMIDNKLYIIDTSNEYSEYKYGEITHINGIELKTLIDEFEKSMSYSTEEWLFRRIEVCFTRLETILSLPSINSNSDKIKYTLLKDGKQEELELSVDRKYDLDFTRDENYSVSIDKENKYIKLIYSLCSEKEEGLMLKTINHIDELSKENNIRNFILDLRDNVGGGSGIITPLIKYLEENANKIIVLTDKGIFSSGVFALHSLKKIGSKFVGTGIASPINHFGNVERFRLPNTQMRVQCSTKYFYYDSETHSGGSLCSKEEFKEFIADKNNIRCFNPEIFNPDFYIENKIEDYISNEDRQLECAVEILSELCLNENKYIK